MPDERPQGDLQACRVLVIEDEYFIARELQGVLADHGAMVVGPVAELSEAMTRVSSGGFDVVMLDINLRDQLAYSIADELLRRHIPFGFATGYSRQVIPDRFRDVKIWEKPYHLQEIIQDLAGFCRCSRQTDFRTRSGRI